MKTPDFYFDENLWERPKELQAWTVFVVSLEEKLKKAVDPAVELKTLEYLGVAYRTVLRLDEAEVTLARAVHLAEGLGTVSRRVQNLVRLAHVYQWKREFRKAYDLHDQINGIRGEHAISEELAASLHQHIGKVLFDGGFYAAAQAEFTLALNERQRLQVPAEQIESSLIAQKESRRRVGAARSLWICRAELRDTPGIHDAHIRSIREVCSKDHAAEEIAGWGHRPFDPEKWHQQILRDWVWIVPSQEKIEGYGHLRIFEKEGRRFGYIYGFYLTPEALGKGLGRSIFEVMLDVLRARNAESVSLDSTITAQEFYHKMGFENIGPEKSVEIGGTPVRCYPMKMILPAKVR
jgi:GNAT superfamily N-acetyltransferase